MKVIKNEQVKDTLNNQDDGTELWSFDTGDYILKIFSTHAGDKIITVGTAGKICTLSAKNGKVILEKQISVFSIFNACYHPIKDVVILGTDQGVYSFDTDLNITVINNDKGWFEHLCINENGNILLASKAKMLYTYTTDGEEFSLIKTDGSFNSTISSIVFNKGSFLISNYGEVREYNETDFTKYEGFPWKTSLLKLAWSPDKKYICCSTQENCLHFWQYPFKKDGDFQISGFPTKINCVSWTNNSRFLALNSDDQIVVWDFSDGPPLGKTPLQLNCGMGKITSIYFKESLLIGTTDKGFILFYNPDQTSDLLGMYSVENSISAILTKSDESMLFVGTEKGNIVAFEITV